jgi:NitT/TauT family transport system substrate-binding protein
MIRRRSFLKSALATGAGVLLPTARARAAEPPPETPRVRFLKFPGLCLAPAYVAEDLLRAEGFTDVQYVEAPAVPDVYDRVASGAIDFSQWYGVPFIEEIDKGRPITVLAGVHIGCNELVATPAVKTIRDLKDKSIAVAYASPATSIIAAMLAYVGLDHRKDVRYVQVSVAESIELLAAGKIDALMATPPVNQELRARKIGHVVVATAVDRPWSQYFCCLFVGNREFVKKHPVATKRVMRAIFKADQLCAQEPERAARTMVDRGFTKRHDYALQTLKDVPYGKWRQYDPEDMVRFYSLRLREAGLIKSAPQKIIAEGTDWRFLNELKKELKG